MSLHYEMLHVLSCPALCLCVSSVLLAFWSPCLGKRGLVFVLIVQLFVSFAHVNLIFVTFSLPPCVRGWLRPLLVALPGLFCLPFYITIIHNHRVDWNWQAPLCLTVHIPLCLLYSFYGIPWKEIVFWTNRCTPDKVTRAFYTPSHKKWRGIMLYPPNFECPSVRLSVRQRFVSVL